MRLLFVVQRYGREVPGGAELCCREYATRLAGRGHRVEVLTSRAVSYVDWRDAYAPGDHVLDGVTVHRLSVRHERDRRFFEPLNTRLLWSGPRAAPVLEDDWMLAQGPVLEGLEGWLTERAPAFDVVVFFTYLYATTWTGLPRVARWVPTVLVPTAHDEPPLWLPLFGAVFASPTRLAYLTEEEQMLISRRVHDSRPGAVVGIGADLDRVGDGAAFRRAFGLGDRPYLLYVGRVDESKGSVELYEQFVAYRDRRDGAGDRQPDLVIVGEPVSPLAPHPGVLSTGFVDEQTKADAMGGALALVNPSYFESFSMVLSESWVQRRPVLVQGHSEVLAGQVRRSGGGLAYRDFAEFEAAVDLLLTRPGGGDRLGRAGRDYVETRYRWDDVIERLEALIRTAGASFRAGRAIGAAAGRSRPA